MVTVKSQVQLYPWGKRRGMWRLLGCWNAGSHDLGGVTLETILPTAPFS
jgi:hypothetical protein